MVGYELADRQLVPVYALTAEGQSMLRAVLHRVAIQRPDLVYAPQLWPLLALLLHYHSATVAHACLLALLNQPGMLAQTRSEWKGLCVALEQLGPPDRPALLPFSPSRSGSVGELSDIAHWAFSVWRLPLAYLVPMLDCFLMEGRKVLFRAGLQVSTPNSVSVFILIIAWLRTIVVKSAQLCLCSLVCVFHLLISAFLGIL